MAEYRKPGDFCWINILTAQPEQAREFFGRVLGWEFFDMKGMGYGLKVGGRNIGGLFDLEGPDVPAGCVPMIGVMVRVDDADATCERVKALGGTAEPAFDVLDSGRMAVCHDPNGAKFDVWEPKAMLGSDADRSLHGAPSWSESMTTDVGRATEFYRDLFGWTAEVKAMPGMSYTVFKNGGAEIAGMMAIPPAEGGIPPHWGTYFTVDDVDAAADAAVKLGGTLFVPPMDIPGIGRFSGITSPQGVRFSVIQYAPRA